jgi:hypothetical protein
MLSGRERKQFHTAVRYMAGCINNGYVHVRESGVHELIDAFTSPTQVPHLVYCNNTSCAYNTENACGNDHVILDHSAGRPQCLTYKRKDEPGELPKTSNESAKANEEEKSS